MISRLPSVYGALLVESVRRREWVAKMRRDAATLQEELATYQDEEVKRYAVSDENKDPILDDGLAYFVPHGPYKEQIKKYKNQAAVSGSVIITVRNTPVIRIKMSTCTGLAALDHADTKFSNGYAATGVGACIDGRHEFMLPNGVGDLQKGER